MHGSDYSGGRYMKTLYSGFFGAGFFLLVGLPGAYAAVEGVKPNFPGQLQNKVQESQGQQSQQGTDTDDTIRKAEKKEAAKKKPASRERREEVQHSLKQLVTFSRQASSEIRREIKRLKAQEGKRLNDADVKNALDMAEKLDKYALLLRQKEKSLTDNDPNIDETRQAMTDMSQQLQLQLQDAMNKQQQAMQILSNIMKNQHDTLKSIINNMK